MSSLHEPLPVSVVRNPSPSLPLSSLHLCLLPNEAENESDTVLHLPAPAERERGQHRSFLLQAPLTPGRARPGENALFPKALPACLGLESQEEGTT